jgi:hypothetical protein
VKNAFAKIRTVEEIEKIGADVQASKSKSPLLEGGVKNAFVKIRTVEEIEKIGADLQASSLSYPSFAEGWPRRIIIVVLPKARRGRGGRADRSKEG